MDETYDRRMEFIRVLAYLTAFLVAVNAVLTFGHVAGWMS